MPAETQVTSSEEHYRPPLQREMATISSMYGEILDYTSRHLLCVINTKPNRRLEPKRFVIIERFPHYLGIIKSFKSTQEADAQELWEKNYKPVVPIYDDYLDSQAT